MLHARAFRNSSLDERGWDEFSLSKTISTHGASAGLFREQDTALIIFYCAFTLGQSWASQLLFGRYIHPAEKMCNRGLKRIHVKCADYHRLLHLVQSM